MDTDGRWTLKRGRKRSAGEGQPEARVADAIVVPVFGYKNHLESDRLAAGTGLGPRSPTRRPSGFIRRFAVTDAAAHDGRQLSQLLDPANTASGVWADTAYRSAANVALLTRRGLVSQFQPRSRAVGGCHRRSPAATPRGRGSGSRSSMSSPRRNAGLA